MEHFLTNMRNYNYILQVWDKDTEELVGQISSFSQESLLEKLGHIDGSIKAYEEEMETAEKEAQVAEEEKEIMSKGNY